MHHCPGWTSEEQIQHTVIAGSAQANTVQLIKEPGKLLSTENNYSTLCHKVHICREYAVYSQEVYLFSIKYKLSLVYIVITLNA